MKHWSPKLHQHYVDYMDDLKKQYPELKFPFEKSIFPTTTYNLGPRTVSYPHIDFANLAFGWCAITALGSFDYKKGGHLILWDLNLVIEFPPGSTILIPSAILSHSNTTIDEQERRYSVVQYAAGGLFRWVDNGYQTADSLTAEEKAKRKSINAMQWERALSFFRVFPGRSSK